LFDGTAAFAWTEMFAASTAPPPCYRPLLPADISQALGENLLAVLTDPSPKDLGYHRVGGT
jgi:hypothetical protein